jgi:hypothetical protein
MVTSTQNNKLLVKLAQDRRYRFLKNGTVQKKGSDGKFRTVGSDRHGYTVVHYRGKKLVAARAIAVREALNEGANGTLISKILTNTVIFHKNRKSDDNRVVNLRPIRAGKYPKTQKRGLTADQIKKMVALFCKGYSVAKIARRFRRKISRSYISRIIKRELNVEA